MNAGDEAGVRYLGDGIRARRRLSEDGSGIGGARLWNCSVGWDME